MAFRFNAPRPPRRALRATGIRIFRPGHGAAAAEVLGHWRWQLLTDGCIWQKTRRLPIYRPTAAATCKNILAKKPNRPACLEECTDLSQEVRRIGAEEKQSAWRSHCFQGFCIQGFWRGHCFQGFCIQGFRMLRIPTHKSGSRRFVPWGGKR